MFGQPPGRGGAASTLPTYDLSLGDITAPGSTCSTSKSTIAREKLGVLDSLMTVVGAKKKLLPSMLPVEGGWYSSNFGWRIDPFNGVRAFHEGMDFMAESGTAVACSGRRGGRRSLISTPNMVI